VRRYGTCLPLILDKVFLNNPWRVHKDLRRDTNEKPLKTLPDRLHMNDPDIKITGSVRRSSDDGSCSNNADWFKSFKDERHGLA
jgi:hypothetical protein